MLNVMRQPQCLGQCRRNRTFSSNIVRMASLPVGDTRKAPGPSKPPCRRKTDRGAKNLVPGSEGPAEGAGAGSHRAF
jgi:hypothetical protein